MVILPNEPKRPPATGGVCVSYMVLQRGNWISRVKFNFTLAHFFILRSGHVHKSSDEPTDSYDVPDGRLSVVTTDNSSATGFTFK